MNINRIFLNITKNFGLLILSLFLVTISPVSGATTTSNTHVTKAKATKKHYKSHHRAKKIKGTTIYGASKANKSSGKKAGSSISALEDATPYPNRSFHWETYNMDTAQAHELQDRIIKIAALARGEVGVGVYSFKSGQEFYLNGNQFFPMASTYKVAIAVRVLQLVQQGRLALNTMVPITANDMVPGGIMTDEVYKQKMSLSILDLLSLMIRHSDNTSTDKLLSLVGGPAAVTETIRSLGIKDMNVDRSVLLIIADTLGVRDQILAIPPEQRTKAMVEKIFSQASHKKIIAARKEMLVSKQDSTTPIAMVQLLRLIATNQTLKPKYTDLLIDIMSQTATGKNRIKYELPKNLIVAHKTGTLRGAISDVGYIMMPNPIGEIAIVVYVKDNTSGKVSSSSIIAHIARVTYDFFTQKQKR